MLNSKLLCILELDGARLCAVSAQLTGEGAEVKRWLSRERPDSVPAEDPEAVGRWAAEELDRAGIPRGAAVISVSRGDVVLKHLALPRPKDGADIDVGAMVRLQMARQLALPIDSTAIDFAPLPENPSDVTIPVIAGAMPTNRVLWCRAFAKAAGLKLRRIGLRCFGVSALLGPLSQTRAGVIVGVAVGWGSTELVIVEDGQMAFARAVDLPRPASRGELDAFAERVAVEVKRAWIGYRAGKPGPVPDLVVVLGEGDLVRQVGGRCAAELSTECKVVPPPPGIVLPAEMPESEKSAAAPLLGLLAESSLGRPTLDFANPRRPVDKAARRRQLTLAGALAALVLGGGLYTLGKSEADRIEAAVSELDKERGELTREYGAFLAQHARLSHLQAWTQGKVDWLAHINVLCGQVPQGGVAYAEDLRGQADSKVVFTPGAGAYPKGEWKLLPSAMFDFKGRSPGPRVATEMRARLLDGDLYSVEILGPDVTDRFALQLRTGRLTPMPPPAPGAEGEKPGKPKPEKKAKAPAKPADKPATPEKAPDKPPAEPPKDAPKKEGGEP